MRLCYCREHNVEGVVVVVGVHDACVGAPTVVFDLVAQRLLLRRPRRHHRVLCGGDGGADGAAAVEVELHVVARRHGVRPPEVEQVRRPAQHRLLDAGAAAEAKVVQPRVDQEERLLVDGLVEGVLHDVADEARQRRHARRIPHHCEDCFEEGAEAGVLALRGDDEARRVHVRHSALWEGLDDDGEVAVVLGDELVEEVPREREWRVPRVVRPVEGLGSVDVRLGPLARDEVLDVVPDSVKHESVVIHSCKFFSKLAVCTHALAGGVHLKMSALVRVCHD
mmetsp:Transcript_6002/g.11634  ORF Transcript_6002/g.11634 Transcript_6002/m.11634 type:complete len:280 (+) Transcript_6002:313-1152(+)